MTMMTPPEFTLNDRRDDLWVSSISGASEALRRPPLLRFVVTQFQQVD